MWGRVSDPSRASKARQAFAFVLFKPCHQYLPMKPSPPRLRYRMPAEWEPHASTWLAWPHYRGDWPGKFEPIPWVYAEIIRHLGRHERIDLIVNSTASEKHARKVLSKANALSKNVHFHRWPTNRVWTRDSGCTFVVADLPSTVIPSEADRSLANDRRGRGTSGANLTAIKWRFNAWAKYPNYQHDEKIGSRMAKAADAEEIRPMHGKSRIVLEGGSIDVNGRGTLLTTEECLLSKTQQRNPKMSRADYEKLFSDFLGITNVIWLDSGIAGDDTHGHVDDITRFVSPDTVVTAIESDPDDPNYEPLRENIRPPARRHRSGWTSPWPSSNSPCPAPCFSRSAASPPATPIFTSPTESCWSRSSTIPTTASPWIFWPICFLTGKSSEYIQET